MQYRQLPLPIKWSFSYSESEFVVSDCNRYSFDWLQKWPGNLRDNFVCLVGESGAGKTHLAHIWAKKHDACFLDASGDIFGKWLDMSSNEQGKRFFVLDDADEICEDMLLFYIYNTIREKNAHMLFTAKDAPAKWGIGLEDTKSRMSTVNVIRLQGPNEEAILSIIEKMFQQRGILIKKEIAQYIAHRIERTYDSINYWVNKVDSIVRIEGRCSLSLVKSIFSEKN